MDYVRAALCSGSSSGVPMTSIGFIELMDSSCSDKEYGFLPRQIFYYFLNNQLTSHPFHPPLSLSCGSDYVSSFTIVLAFYSCISYA